MEAYGNYEELLASGVELMQLIKIQEEGDEREIFSVHEDEGEEEEGGEGRGVGSEVNGEVYPLVSSPTSPHSPYKRKDILYITESESNLASYTIKQKGRHLGDNLAQFPPNSASIYSSGSMLSIHSAVEAESSRHDEMEVGREGDEE